MHLEVLHLSGISSCIGDLITSYLTTDSISIAIIVTINLVFFIIIVINNVIIIIIIFFLKMKDCVGLIDVILKWKHGCHLCQNICGN